MQPVDLIVVGAGPAGLAAAVTAGRVGVDVTVVDEYPSPGGQYLKGMALAKAASPIAPAEWEGRALLEALAGLEVDMRLETMVWSIAASGDTRYPFNLALYGPAGPAWLSARAVVIAAGARELVIPFPGWTLPGVMTAGALQILAKGSGVLPGKRILLAGSGPLLLAAASELAGRGATVIAVLESTHPRQWLGHSPAMWGHWDRLVEGWRYARTMYRTQVPYRFGWTVSRALGEATVEAVTLVRLDGRGRPAPGSEETVEIDALGLSFGFVPNVELTRLAGCKHDFVSARGGWTPRLNERLESSRPGLFVAGETAGVSGAGGALLQGRLAGLAAASRLGFVSEAELDQVLAGAASSRRRHSRFGAMLNTLFRPQLDTDALTTADTVICRCEEVTAGDITTSIDGGAGQLDALKIWTRVGQGPCQGRTCGPLLARLIARRTGRPEVEAGFFSVRPPVKPAPLEALALGEKR